MSRLGVVVGLGLIWCCTSTRARAADTDLEPAPSAAAQTRRQGATADALARAREHYLEGTRWLESGEWAQALAAYERAQALYPSASTAFNMAYCNSQLGRLVAAWLHVSDALRLSESSETLRLTPERRAVVEEERERLRARVPTILFQGTGQFEINVFGGRIRQARDAELLYYLEATNEAEQEWVRVSAGARVLVDPGVHRLAIRSTGKIFPQQLRLDEGQTVVVAEPEVPPIPQPSPAAGAPLGAGPRAPSRSASPRPNPYRTPGVISLALGGAALLAAGVSIGFMLDAESALNGNCDEDGTCPDTLSPKVRQYQNSAIAANVGIAAGVSASALGVGLLWLDAKGQSQRIRAAISPTSLKVSTTF